MSEPVNVESIKASVAEYHWTNANVPANDDCLLDFGQFVKPDIVTAMLDEIEALRKRVAELESKLVELRQRRDAIDKDGK